MQMQFTLNQLEFDGHLAAICLSLSELKASAIEGNFKNMDQRIAMTESHVVKLMRMLPQGMRDEIVEISRQVLQQPADA